MKHKWAKKPVQRIPVNAPLEERKRIKHANRGHVCDHCGMERRSRMTTRAGALDGGYFYTRGPLGDKCVFPGGRAGTRVPECPERHTGPVVDDVREAFFRARVQRISTLATKLAGIDWSMVAAGTHIALPSIRPIVGELEHEARRLAAEIYQIKLKLEGVGARWPGP